MTFFKSMTRSERAGFALFVAVIVCFMVWLHIFGGYRSYKLPDGRVVKCTDITETTHGNFHLRGCEGGKEYYVQGTVEVSQ